MSLTGNFAANLMSHRPNGVSYTNFPLALSATSGFSDALYSDIGDGLYASLVSFCEAINGLNTNKTSWAAIKLYYSSFFSFKTSLLIDHIIPFFHTRYFICDASSGSVKIGGNSSHHWNWASINSVKRLSKWCYSPDSQNAYDAVRNIREDANYRFAFPDPKWLKCFEFVQKEGVSRAINIYKNDDTFFYNYLQDHIALAYPTKILYFLVSECQNAGITLDKDRAAHVQRIWPLQGKPPLP